MKVSISLLLLAALCFGAVLATYDSFDYIGNSHNNIEVPVNLPFTGGKQNPATTNCQGPAGEKACQQLTDGSYEVMMRRPKSFLPHLYEVSRFRSSSDCAPYGIIGFYTPAPQLAVGNVFQYVKISATPTTLAENTDYYVTDIDALCTAGGEAVFRLSTTLAGTPVTMASVGDGSALFQQQGLRYEGNQWRVGAGQLFSDGDPIQIVAVGSYDTTTPVQIAAATAYFVKSSCGSCSTSLIELYSDAALTTRITGTAHGGGLYSVLSGGTYTVNSGSAATALPTNPVVTQIVGSNYELTNGLIGVRIPTTASNSACDRAAIQGLKFGSTWTANGYSGAPNYLYREPTTGGGGNGDAFPATQFWGATSCKTFIMEQGPILTRFLVTFTFPPTSYTVQSGTVPVVGAGSGFWRTIITIHANSPEIDVIDDTDMNAGYYLNVEPEMTLDRVRYAPSMVIKGTGNDTLITFTTNQNFRLCSYCIFDSTGDQPTGTYTDYKGRYFAAYSNAGAGGSPSLWVRVNAIENDYYSTSLSKMFFKDAASPFFGGGSATILANIFYMNTGNGTYRPRFKISFSIGVGTKNDVGTDLSVNPLVAKYTYSKGEVGLDRLHSDLYNYALLGTPGNGNCLYQSGTDCDALATKVNTDSAYAAQLITEMTASNDTAVGKRIAQLWQTANSAYLKRLLVPVDNQVELLFNKFETLGVHAPSYSYYEGLIQPAVNLAVLPVALRNSNATAADKVFVKRQSLFMGALSLDERYLPLLSPWEQLGLQNQQTVAAILRNTFTCALSSHPSFLSNVNAAIANLNLVNSTVFYTYGEVLQSLHYSSGNVEPQKNSLAACAYSGASSITGSQTATFLANLGFHANAMSPPDPRLTGAPRFLHPLGDGEVEPTPQPGTYSGTFNDSTGWYTWNANGRFRSPYYATSILTVKDTYSSGSEPSRVSQNYPYFWPVLRHGAGTSHETFVSMLTNGNPNEHLHTSEDASLPLIIWAHSTPLMTFWDGGQSASRVADTMFKNRVELESAYARAWDSDSQPINEQDTNFLGAYWQANGTLATQNEFASFANASGARATATRTDTTAWTRQIQTLFDDVNYPIFTIYDTFTGTSATASRIWGENFAAVSTVAAPGGNYTPTTRSYGASQRPSNSDTAPTAHNVNLTAGALNTFTWTGQGWNNNPSGIMDWKHYVIPGGSSPQFNIGNYATPWLAGETVALYGAGENKMHTLRIKGNGAMRQIILPYLKGNAPSGLSVGYSGGVVTISYGTTTRTFDDAFTYDTYTNGTIKTIRSWDPSSHSAHGITVNGGPQEAYSADSSHVTWTVCGMTGSTRTLDLSAFGGNWYADRPLGNPSANVFTLYNSGGVQPSCYTVNFTTTSGTRRTVALAFRNAAADSVRVRFGSATDYVGLGSCSTTCALSILAPTGAQSFSYEYLLSGAVIGTSGVSTITVN